MNYAGGLKDEIIIPEKDTSGYKTEASYRYLEGDGIIYPEAEVNEGEVMIGKMSPPKFLSEAFGGFHFPKIIESNISNATGNHHENPINTG